MKEVTYEDWQENPTPRMMWVWSYDEDNKVQRKVIYILKAGVYENPVLTVADESTYECYKHCAEIEKTRPMTNQEQKTRPMTNQELAWWLSDGKRREFKHESYNNVYSTFLYTEDCSNSFVTDDILIRENGGEWHEPLVEVEL